MIDYEETKSQPITRMMVWRAYGRVKANKGGSGIDNMSWEYLEKHQYAELDKLWNRLTSGSYFPQAVKQVAIPKKGGGERLLGNIFLHVVFDKWMEKNHSGKPFERYADDIVVHCKSEKQAIFMLRQISQRMTECKLTLHPEKTKIIDLCGKAQKRYPKGYDFLGFSIKHGAYNHKGQVFAMSGIFVSQKSKNSIMQKIREMNIHKRRTSLLHIAKVINPTLRGIINYYHNFRKSDMWLVWNSLNARLIKWVRWEMDYGKKKAICYLQTKYKEKPDLFAHWRLAHS